MVADSHMTGEDFRRRIRILSDLFETSLCSPDYLLTLYVNHTNLKIELLPLPSRWEGSKQEPGCPAGFSLPVAMGKAHCAHDLGPGYHFIFLMIPVSVLPLCDTIGNIGSSSCG